MSMPPPLRLGVLELGIDPLIRLRPGRELGEKSEGHPSRLALHGEEFGGTAVRGGHCDRRDVENKKIPMPKPRRETAPI